MVVGFNISSITGEVFSYIATFVANRLFIMFIFMIPSNKQLICHTKVVLIVIQTSTPLKFSFYLNSTQANVHISLNFNIEVTVMKQYSKENIAEALESIRNNEMSTTAASKLYKIPAQTLRDRLKRAGIKSKKLYSSETVDKALCDIRNKSLSVVGASKKYKIPVQTLRDRLKGRHNKVYGKSTILSTLQEKQLAEWIILCARSGYPKSKLQILRTAEEVSKLSSGSNFLKSKPTTGWFQKFQQRHPEISDRKPEPLGKASASITAEGLKNYFDLVKTQLEEAGHHDLLSKPQSWWNVDETGFEMNPTPRIVYAEKGLKTVHTIEKGSAKENITCTYAVCGDGSYIPPLITFKESFSNLDLAVYVSKGKENRLRQTTFVFKYTLLQMLEVTLVSIILNVDG